MSVMSAVYIQQRVWRVTRSHDLWHVLPTLKRTITKSTLHVIEGTTYLCALHPRIALGAHATSTFPEHRKICSRVPEAQGFRFQTQNHQNHLEQLGTDQKQAYQRWFWHVYGSYTSLFLFIPACFWPIYIHPLSVFSLSYLASFWQLSEVCFHTYCISLGITALYLVFVKNSKLWTPTKVHDAMYGKRPGNMGWCEKHGNSRTSNSPRESMATSTPSINMWFCWHSNMSKWKPLAVSNISGVQENSFWSSRRTGTWFQNLEIVGSNFGEVDSGMCMAVTHHHFHVSFTFYLFNLVRAYFQPNIYISPLHTLFSQLSCLPWQLAKVCLCIHLFNYHTYCISLGYYCEFWRYRDLILSVRITGTTQNHQKQLYQSWAQDGFTYYIPLFPCTFFIDHLSNLVWGYFWPIYIVHPSATNFSSTKWAHVWLV